MSLIRRQIINMSEPFDDFNELNLMHNDSYGFLIAFSFFYMLQNKLIENFYIILTSYLL